MGRPATNGNGRIQRAQNGGGDLAGMLQKMSGEMARALPQHIRPDRMARVFLTALRTTPDLAQCSQASFLASVMTLSQLGLEPNTPLGHAYLIPRLMKQPDGSRVRECTVIIGYQGLMDLARRSGQVTAIWGFPVYEGDDFKVTLGLNPDIRHEPGNGDQDASRLTHVYACASLRDSDRPVFVVLTREAIEEARKRGGSRKFSPWQTDYVAMAMKTAVRRLYKWLPKTLEMATAAAIDEAPENGQHQIAVLDAQVADVLRSHGHSLEAAGEEVEDEDPFDVPEEAEREPGEEG